MKKLLLVLWLSLTITGIAGPWHCPSGIPGPWHCPSGIPGRNCHKHPAPENPDLLKFVLPLQPEDFINSATEDWLDLLGLSTEA
jgi:hypothetical protein